MHGKIIQYSNTSSSGIIINYAKKLFDFKGSYWHDKTRLPEVGLFVEFRLNEGGVNIVDVRASKYQEFAKDSIVKEHDFWKTNTDEELEKLESNIFDGMVAEAVKEIDFQSIHSIPSSIDVDRFIYYHFENESKVINNAMKFRVTGTMLDYRSMSPFVERAINLLIFLDKRIYMDHFAMYLGILNKLKYIDSTYYAVKHNEKTAFNEKFLSHQLYYNAAQRVLLSIKEEALILENRIKNIKGQINISALYMSNKNTAIEPNRIDKLNNSLMKLNTQIQEKMREKNNVEKLMIAYIKSNEKYFYRKFVENKKIILKNVKAALNITLSALDDHLYKLAMNSDSVCLSFLKTQRNYTFSTLTFMQQYLKTLDASKMNPVDKTLDIFVTNIRDKYEKKALIFSNNADFEQLIKVRWLRKSKYFSTFSATKKNEYLISIDNESFDCIFIDEITEDIKVMELIMSAKNSKKNSNTSIVLVNLHINN